MELLRQSVVVGVGGGLCTVGRADLGEDMVDMPFDGIAADHKRPGDLGVAFASGKQAQYLDLALGQSIGETRTED